MRYRYLDDFRRGISVFAIFSYGIAVLGTPQCPPPSEKLQSSFTTDLYHHESCLIKLALGKLNRRQQLPDREAKSKVIC